MTTAQLHSHRTLTIALVFVCLTLATAPALAQRPLSLHASIGASMHGWQSGLGRTPVRLETEALKAWRFEGRIGWRDRTLLSLQHAQSMTDSPAQREMLAASGEQTTALTRTLGYLDLLTMIVGSNRYRDGDMGYLERLLGLRIEYSQDLFHAGTASSIDFAYVSFSDPDNFKEFKDGEQLGFKTTFRDLRVSAPVWFDPIYAGAVVRVGYFRSRWEKVAEVSEGPFGGLPLLQDTRLDTDGLTVSYENRLEWPGLGWALGADLGVMGRDLVSPLPVTAGAGNDTVIRYGAIRGELRLNLAAGRGRGGLAATVGAGFELRGWDLSHRDLDRDLLTRVFGRVGFDLVF